MTDDNSSSWDDFKMPSGGTAKELSISIIKLRKSVIKDMKSLGYMPKSKNIKVKNELD